MQLAADTQVHDVTACAEYVVLIKALLGQAYGQSKLANILYGKSLQRR